MPAIAAIVAAAAAGAGETDQYMTWTVELSDCAPALNTYLDTEIQAFVDKMNRRNDQVEDVVALTEELYRHLFAGLHASRVRKWLRNTDAVERYPGDEFSDWAYQRLSIFREPAFPFVLPMAQTIRVGEVYLGIDKIGHMFGFGRRYFQIYHRFRDEGDSHDASVDRMLVWGIRNELSMVGKLVDGIFSNGDMEANYQGFRLAMAFGSGEAALFYREDGAWRYRGGLDIRNYITPDLDESFNTNDYAGWRGRRVLPVVEAEYSGPEERQAREARFKRYTRNYKPSRSKVFVDAWFDRQEAAAPEPVARK